VNRSLTCAETQVLAVIAFLGGRGMPIAESHQQYVAAGMVSRYLYLVRFAG